jgi:hypothetical protein
VTLMKRSPISTHRNKRDNSDLIVTWRRNRDVGLNVHDLRPSPLLNSNGSHGCSSHKGQHDHQVSTTNTLKLCGQRQKHIKIFYGQYPRMTPLMHPLQHYIKEALSVESRCIPGYCHFMGFSALIYHV